MKIKYVILLNFIIFHSYVNNEIIKLKVHEYKNKYKCEKLVFFGAGDYFAQNYHKFRGACDVDLLCDSNKSKWGKIIVDNIVCSSPESIKNINNYRVIIAVEQVGMSFEIMEILNSLEIRNVDHIDNFIKYIVGIK